MTDGREYLLGTPGEVREASDAIIALTGGSSGQRRWSALWGSVVYGPSNPIIDPQLAELIAAAAADFRSVADIRLPDSAKLLLDRVAAIGPRVQRQRSASVTVTSET